MSAPDHAVHRLLVRLNLAALLVALTAGCATATSSAPTAASNSSSTPTVVIGQSPAAPATPATNVLTGTWVTGDVTCAQKEAALANAGFTQAQLDAAGWTCPGDPFPPFTIRFSAGRLVMFLDGAIAWDGMYKVADDDTFQAGDSGSLYITYEFAITGNELTIDMVANDFPGADELTQLGEDVQQTAIYESAPFTRQP